MKQNSTLIAVVLDRSGSMGSIVMDTIGGFNTFVEAQKQGPGECFITLTQFDTEYEIVYSGKNINDVPKLDTKSYVPRGGTALYDAVGRTINEIGANLANRSEGERPSKVIFCIVTDGEENASKEFTQTAIKKLIKQQTKDYSWDFTFLGANIDSFAAGGGIGIRKSAVMNYAANTRGSKGLYAGIAASVLRSRISGEAMTYTSAERNSAMGNGND